MTDAAVIVSAVRTPIGEAGRSLSTVPAWDLGILVAKEAIRRAGIEATAFDDGPFGVIRRRGRIWSDLDHAHGREVAPPIIPKPCATSLIAR